MSPAPSSRNAPVETIRTPAKINLGLRITGLRADGYHLLDSVFAPVSLFDEIEIAWAPDAGADELSVDFGVVIPGSAGLPKALAGVTDGPDNLVVRAAKSFGAASGLGGEARIQLTKRIPAGAGLGGGSSDAGAVLSAFARLAGPQGLDAAGLVALALELGADVPYFLDPRPARVLGIGEEISPIEGFPSLPLVLANPGISVATAAVYGVADQRQDSLTPVGAGSTMRAISRLCGETSDWGPALGDLLVNDLEPAAIQLCPPIGRLIERMREAGALGAGMSGSGATVFGIFASEQKAAEAALALRAASQDQLNGRDLEPAAPWVHQARIESSDSSGS